MSCDHSHMPLPHNKEKEKENQKKRNIKLRKIDKRKRKVLVSKHTITQKSIHSYIYLLFMRNIYVRDKETMRENMRRLLLLYKVLTDHIHR